MSESRSKAVRALELSREGLSWADIGGVLGWSPSTAQSMASRVKRWDYHRAMQKVTEKKRRTVYRGRGKKFVGVNWTEEMENNLRRIWEFQTGDMIARAFSIQYDVRLTRNAVIAKARRLKLPPKPPYRPGWHNLGSTNAQPITRERAPFI